jgi:predicted outer membrane repeat protein
MPLFSWLHKRVTGRNHRKCTSARWEARRFRPQLEALEGRDVPSTLTVTNNLDSGAGSLRADIAAANPGDTINFAPTLDGRAVTLTSGQLVINKNLTIQGPGAALLAISGGNRCRVFEVLGPNNTNVNVTLNGLTITQGYAPGSPWGGGAVLNLFSTLTLSGCILSNNRANAGGAIYDYGGAALQIVNSTLSGNKAIDLNGNGYGGAVCINLGSNVTMTSCTFSNNSATFEGGAVWTHDTIGHITTIEGCSFSGNVEGSYPVGNDIYNLASASTLKVSDSVFSNNTPYRFSPIQGLWTNGGGTTFHY